MKQYVRLKFKTDLGRARTVWAIKRSPKTFLVVDKEGETEKLVGHEKDGTPIVRVEVVIADARDIVFERPATMSKKYAELVELVEG